MNETVRQFPALPADENRGDEPLLVGIEGPPGGGKSMSALRIGRGIQRVRPGPIIVIDTEGGRAKKFAGEFKFLHVLFDPPYRSDHFLDAIKQQLKLKPACIIVDSMSDEHEGEAGYLE